MLARVRTLRGAGFVAILLVLAACKTILPDIDQRVTQGPTATELWTLRMMQQARREPSFDEKRSFESEMDDRIGRYLRDNPEAANALNVSTFRFLKQVTVGMDKGQVEILLGTPATTTRDAAQMQSLSRHFWPDIRGKADEAWSYPLGWVIYFADSKVVDITQYMPRT
jgi:hypothetical protein